MTRGTFANIRIRNQLAPGTEGGVTRHLPDGAADERLRRGGRIPEARGCRWSCWPAPNMAPAAAATGRPRERFCSACGQCSAVSFERIHRSNLVGMGVLPLELPEGKNWRRSGPDRRRDVRHRRPRRLAAAGRASSPCGPQRRRQSERVLLPVRIDTPVELEYYRNGGILQTVLRKMLDNPAGA